MEGDEVIQSVDELGSEMLPDVIHHALLDGAPVLVVDRLCEYLGAPQVRCHDDQRVLEGHGVTLQGERGGREGADGGSSEGIRLIGVMIYDSSSIRNWSAEYSRSNTLYV